jgi:cytochrome P450
MRHGLSREQCESECVVQVIAGSDTTGTTIRTALMSVIGTPRVYSRFMEEARSAMDAGLIPSTSPITLEQGKKLPYLQVCRVSGINQVRVLMFAEQAVIYESIRIRPPALFGHFKSVPDGGDTIDGVFLPGGTGIGHNIVALMMSETTFGADTAVFRPERFLECDAAQRTEMERVVELAFGSGRWMCAGKQIVFTQLNKVIFELLRTFDFQPVNGSRPWEEESAVFWYQRNMVVRIAELQETS